MNKLRRMARYLPRTVRSLLGRSSTIERPDSDYVVVFRDCKFLASQANKIEKRLLQGDEAYDWDNFEVMRSFVNKGDVCFDIGANIGVYSIVLGRISGDVSNVHAFEPVAHMRSRLEANAKLNGFHSININAMAVGNHVGNLEMYQVKQEVFRGGVSTFVRNENVESLGEDKFEKRKTEIITLDKYIEDHQIDRLDFIKMDVEGFEPEVFRGGEQSIRRLRPTILFEYKFERQEYVSLFDYGNTLKEWGYSAYEYSCVGDKLVLNEYDFAAKPRSHNLLLFSQKLARR